MKLEMVLSIIGCITGIVSLIISIISYYKTLHIGIVKDFFLSRDSKSDMDARYAIFKEYDRSKLRNEEYKKAAAWISSNYQIWGMMVEKKYLPIWVFDGPAGRAAKKYFRAAKPYIDFRRNQDKNETEGYRLELLYAGYFEILIKRISKREKKFKQK